MNILISFILGRLQFGVQDLINRRNAELTATVAERTNNLMLIKSMSAEAKEAAAGGERMQASQFSEGSAMISLTRSTAPWALLKEVQYPQYALRILVSCYASFVILQKVSSYDGALMWSLVAALPVNILISFILGRLQFGVQDLINRRGCYSHRTAGADLPSCARPYAADSCPCGLCRGY